MTGFGTSNPILRKYEYEGHMTKSTDEGQKERATKYIF